MRAFCHKDESDATSPTKRSWWQAFRFDHCVSTYTDLADLVERASHVSKEFWVKLDLRRLDELEIGVIKAGLQSHHELVGKPESMRACEVDRRRVGE